jgi:hypothetical protein
LNNLLLNSAPATAARRLPPIRQGAGSPPAYGRGSGNKASVDLGLNLPYHRKAGEIGKAVLQRSDVEQAENVFSEMIF